METKAKHRIMMYFTILYMLIFTILSLMNGNYEFLYYTFYMLVILLLVIKYHKKIGLDTTTLFFLTLLGAMHIFGGNIYFGATRLYEFWIIPNIFRYDNLVHIIGGLTAALVSYHFIYYRLEDRIASDWILLSLIVIVLASGVGAIYEILEFTAVLWLNAADKVGDYVNNSFDLVYNLLGAALSIIIIHSWQKAHN